MRIYRFDEIESTSKFLRYNGEGLSNSKSSNFGKRKKRE